MLELSSSDYSKLNLRPHECEPCFYIWNVTTSQLTIISILAIGYFVTKVGKFPKTQKKGCQEAVAVNQEKTPEAANRLV